MKKAVIGLSGGVDSAAAAFLLKEQGYDVYGASLFLSEPVDPDAERIAAALGIPFTVLDMSSVFRKKVISNFADEYVSGRTPNPCILCNALVKFEGLLRYADSIGAEFIATGHYARVIRLPSGRYTLEKAGTKDQTYALCRLSQEVLSRTLMPCGEYDKAEIRQIAAKLGLTVSEKRDSQDICFIPDGNHAAFLAAFLGNALPPAGNFVTESGDILGKHHGIVSYTIGQRKGLGLSMGRPVFVTGIRPDTDEVVIGDACGLFSRNVLASQLNFMGISGFPRPVRAFAKIRYAHPGAPCTATQNEDGTLSVSFDEPQRAVTKGQSLVLYEDGHILASGIIS